MPADNPKRSDPHMRIAHSVYEAVCKVRDISAAELQVFLILLRRSWGFQRKEIRISAERIAEELGRNPRNVRVALSGLVEKNMLHLTGNGKKGLPSTYKPNKFYWTWVGGPSRIQDQVDPESFLNSGSTRSSIETDLILNPDRFDPESGRTDTLKSTASSGQTREAPKPLKKHVKETFKETPLPQRGDGGGCDSVSDLPSEEIEAAQKALFKLTGIFPNSRDYLRVRSVTRSPLPPDWNPDKWHDHCRAVTTELLRKVAIEHREGKAIGCVYAVACTRAKKQLLTDALTPEKFEDEYDESA